MTATGKWKIVRESREKPCTLSLLNQAFACAQESSKVQPPVGHTRQRVSSTTMASNVQPYSQSRLRPGPKLGLLPSEDALTMAAPATTADIIIFDNHDFHESSCE